MQKNAYLKKDIIIIIVLAATVTVFRLVLGGLMMIKFSPDSIYDDTMQFLKVISILNGEWLGGFGPMTLVKGVGYPLLTALFSTLNLPYVFAYHLLYIIACIIFVMAIKPILKNKWLSLVIYVLLIYNPIAFSSELTRLYRDIGYYSVAFIAIGTATGLLLRYDKLKEGFIWGGFAGLSLAFAISFREDSQWLVLFSVGCMLVFVFAGLFNTQNKDVLLKILVVPVIAGLCFFCYTGAVSYINYSHYGYFATNDYNSGAYARAYGALSRLGTNENPYVTIPEEQRRQLYTLSPAFAELEWCLENEDSMYREWVRVQGEYRVGYFSFVLRDVVAATGHYSSAQEANEYYERLAREVNEICDSGLMPSGARRTGVVARYYNWMLSPIIKAWGYEVISVLRCDGIDPTPQPIEGDDKYLRVFEEYTHEEIAAVRYYEDGTTNENFVLSGGKVFLWYCCKLLIFAYKILLPILFIASLGVYLCTGILMFVRKRNNLEIWISWICAGALLCAFLVRCAMLAFVHVSSFPVIGYAPYQAATYPVLLSFCVTALTVGYNVFVEAGFNKREPEEKNLSI